MNLRHKRLENELRLAGASSAEAKQLASLSGHIRRLKDGQSQSWRPVWTFGGIGLAVGLVLGVFLIIFAQAALPGNWLFPVQKMADSLAISVDPAYRASVMMRRAQQVEQLVSNGAPPAAVKATLADYQTEAATYKTSSSNYAAFEYCKSQLQQAANRTTGPERQAINNILTSLNSV